MLALFCSWLFWVVGAALLGFLLAWLMRGAKIGEWKNKWETENTSFKSLKSNHDGYLSKYESLNSKHNKLIVNNKKLSKDLSSYEAKVVNLEEKLSFAGNGATTTNETVKVVDNSYEVRSLESKIERMEKDISLKEEELGRLNEENENLSTKMEVLELTTEEAKKEKEKAIANIKKYEEYRPRFEEANLERNTLKYKYEQLLATKGTFVEGNDQLQGEKTALESEIVKLKASVDQSDNQTKALQFKVQELEEQHTKTSRAYEEVNTKYTSLLNLQERTEAKLKEASNDTTPKNDSELTALKASNEAQAKEIEQLKQSIEQQQKQTTVIDNSAELEALKNKNKALAKENSQLMASLEEQLTKTRTFTVVPASQTTTKEKAKPATKEEKEAKASAAKAQLSAAIGTKIKRATIADKDELQNINGVGPFIEKKLNDLGIYTFEQVSQFDGELVQVVTDAIQFFPGRIQRDDWVGQATSLMKES